MMTDNVELRPKLAELKKIITNMCHHIYRQRPTCADLLCGYKQWCIQESELKRSDDYKNKINLVKINKFFNQFLTTKLNFAQGEMD